MSEIWLGDCLEEMNKIASGSVDMIMVDLPYGTTNCKWDVVIPFEPLWECFKRVIKENGAICCCAAQPFTSALIMSNVKWFRYEWIWHKNKATGFLNAKLRPLVAHENIVVFYKSPPTYNPQGLILKDVPTKRVGRPERSGVYNKAERDAVRTHHNFPQSILENIGVVMKPIHPTQKPVELFKYFINTYTNEGELVLDCCAGVGTCGLACRELKREFILIEKDETYFNKCVEQLAQ